MTNINLNISCGLVLIFLLFNCSGVYPDLYLYPISSNWKLSDNLDNRCIFDRKTINWKSENILVYLVSEEQFFYTYTETAKLNLKSNFDFINEIKSGECKVEYYLLFENYPFDSEIYLDNFIIKIDNAYLYKSQNLKFIYYFDNYIFKTNPVSIDIFSNVRRASRLKFGKKIDEYDSNTDIITERLFMKFCSKEILSDINLMISFKENKNYISKYNVNTECLSH